MVWGVRKRTYPAEFIAMLATVVSTLALVFHTLMTAFRQHAAAVSRLCHLALAVGRGRVLCFQLACVQYTLGVWVMSRGRHCSQPGPKSVMLACLLVVVLRVADVAAPEPESSRLLGLLASALVIHLINLPPLVAGMMTLLFAMPITVVNCICVQRFSTYGDVVVGAVRVSTAAFVMLCSLLIWLANQRRF